MGVDGLNPDATCGTSNTTTHIGHQTARLCIRNLLNVLIKFNAADYGDSPSANFTHYVGLMHSWYRFVSKTVCCARA